ncbi:MAG: flagellar biosynthetic protein FliR [Alphaproteobacteria bacterium]|nr:flagellar biosynthetic protein FliR [Alphaproteobacteria bacterium]
MLQDLFPADVFAFLLVFARIGTALMLMPAIGEIYITPRARLSIALGISLIVTPLVATLLPAMPASPWALLVILVGEIGVGAFIGFSGRILLAALSMAGMVIAYQSSLANAFVRSPVAAEQGALAGAFLTVTALLLIFVTDLHHVMLTGVIESYRLFAPGTLPPVEDFSEAAARLMSRSFVLAMQVAGPFLLAGLVLSLAVGLLNRLMPQVQMFFVIMPLQVMLGFAVLMLTLSAVLLWFLDGFEDAYRSLFLAG